mmetsp:Transcript_25655/g.65953  ORF Transcript_25655/g.65953 Transcript_25655/m.65953 type:complete len:320 (-) Transcript_25655:676-1635(-)
MRSPSWPHGTPSPSRSAELGVGSATVSSGRQTTGSSGNTGGPRALALLECAGGRGAALGILQVDVAVLLAHTGTARTPRPHLRLQAADGSLRLAELLLVLLPRILQPTHLFLATKQCRAAALVVPVTPPRAGQIHSLHPRGKAQGKGRLHGVLVPAADLNEHDQFCRRCRYAILQEHCKFRVSERDVFLLPCHRFHNIAKSRQTAVNVLRFLQRLPFAACLGGILGPCKVNENQATLGGFHWNSLSTDVLHADLQSYNTVGPAGPVVGQRGTRFSETQCRVQHALRLPGIRDRPLTQFQKRLPRSAWGAVGRRSPALVQ